MIFGKGLAHALTIAPGHPRYEETYSAMEEAIILGGAVSEKHFPTMDTLFQPRSGRAGSLEAPLLKQLACNQLDAGWALNPDEYDTRSYAGYIRNLIGYIGEKDAPGH